MAGIATGTEQSAVHQLPAAMKTPCFVKPAVNRTEAVLDRCMMHVAGLNPVVTLVGPDGACLSIGYGVPLHPNLPLRLVK